ncbi:hypothetical protein KY331_01660, partial [Candidatus Woesearchaeota archaeon]|nr:hypothetical protein [Candidatus Woesearchaeota archaeon]
KLHQGILGKYNLPSEIFLEWIDAKGLEKTLDKTYIPTSQREIVMKRLIYTALYSCVNEIDSAIFMPGGSYVKLSHDSPFYLHPTKAITLKKMARDFAINQVVKAWVNKKNWEDSKYIDRPRLAKRMGIKVRGGPLGISVWYRDAVFQFKRKKGRGVEYITTTTANLPGAIFYVNHFHKGAKKLLQGE